jgi:hypothetical protein
MELGNTAGRLGRPHPTGSGRRVYTYQHSTPRGATGSGTVAIIFGLAHKVPPHFERYRYQRDANSNLVIERNCPLGPRCRRRHCAIVLVQQLTSS